MNIHIPFFHSGPSKRFIQEAAAGIPVNTPDLCVLEQAENHFVFDCSKIISKTLSITNAFTKGRLAMWQDTREQHTPPVVMEPWEDWVKDIPRAKIVGGLYSLTIEDLLFLDKYKENGVKFNRKRVDINVPDFSTGRHPIKTTAWMYFGNAQHWGSLISWDHFFYRGKGNFISPSVQQDSRRWVQGYFRYIPQKPDTSSIKCYTHCHKGLREPNH